MTESTRKMISEKVAELANIIVPIGYGVRRIGNVTKRWHLEAIAKHQIASELRVMLEMQKEFNNPTLTCNCLNHSNRRINELTEQLNEILGE